MAFPKGPQSVERVNPDIITVINSSPDSLEASGHIEVPEVQRGLSVPVLRNDTGCTAEVLALAFRNHRLNYGSPPKVRPIPVVIIPNLQEVDVSWT